MRRRRVLVAQIMHETNTFSRLTTDLDSYRARYLHLGAGVPAALRGTATEIAAYLDAAAEQGWEAVTPVAANATPSGPVTAETWAFLKGAVLRAAEAEGPFDGVLLAMHGAMVTETCDDAEGELLEALRVRLGARVPIVTTLDLHANVTDRMAANASAIVAYRTYPHVDQYDRARQAAGICRRAMEGAIAPRVLVRRPAMLTGANDGRTQAGPMVRLLEAAAAHEREAGILAVSVQAGFPWADIAEAGPSVAVTHDDAGTRAEAVAEALCATLWETRHETTDRPLSIAAAMAACREAGPGDRPLVLADASDNPGGGSYGDLPGLLGAMIEARLENAAFALIADPEAVRAGIAAGEGAEITLSLGGKIDPDFVPAIAVTGRVERLTDGRFVCDGPMWKGVAIDMGPTMVLRVGGVQAVVCSNRLQVTDLQTFLSVGIDPRRKSVLAVKSSHHFRAAFGPIARAVLAVDADGLCTRALGRFPYRKVRRPVWPLD